MALFSETSLSTSNNCNCVIEDLLAKPFSSRNYADKLNIISKGRATPLIPTLFTVTKQCKRYLKKQNYDTIPWLCGCVRFAKLFCWPCLLFSTEKNVWTKTGVSDLNNLHNLQKRHELSKSHVVSHIALKQFGKSRIEIGLSEQFQINKERHNELVSHNRHVVSRLIDVTCFLGENQLSFGGHTVSADCMNEGNYVELVKLLRSTDKEFDAYFQSATVFTGQSNDIQNDLIQCVSEVMISEIIKEIQEAPFVAVILDETTDDADKYKISTLLRYVNKEAEVLERFLGYSDFGADRTETALAHHVFRVLKEYKCEEKLMALTYNEAAKVAREGHSLQAQIKTRHSSALFVHYHAHSMNLVLRNSVDHIKQCKIFFVTVTGLCSYFSKSCKRTYTLYQEIHKRFPFVAPIRWNCYSKLVCTIMEYKHELIVVFEHIIEHRDKWDIESYNGAKGFLCTLQDFDFNFILKLFSTLLPQADLIFDNLQRKIFDVGYCLKQINDFESSLDKMRADYDAFWPEMVEQNNSTEYCSKKQRVENVTGDKKNTYRRLYYEVIDTIKSKLNRRFSDVNHLNFFSLLDSSKFQEFSSKFPEEHFACLKTGYWQYFELARLRSELSAIYSNTLFSQDSVYELLKYLHIGELSDVLPQVYKLVQLVVTIPITSVSNETAFSTLNRIKNTLHNSQTEKRLSALSLLSIEKALLSSLKKKPNFYNEVIDLFAKKPRRIEFLYKY